MIREDKKAKYYFVFMLVYIFTYVAIQIFWISKTTPEEVIFATLPGYASHAHIIQIARITNILKNSELWDIQEISTLDISYPPLYHFIIAFSQFMLKEPSYFIMRIVTLFFGIALLILTYKFAEDCFSSEAGLFSCIILSLYPQFYNYFTVVTPHICLMLMTLLSLYFLYKCQYFRVRKHSILFGLTFGISLFVKHEAFVFLFLPLLYIIIKSLKHRNRESLSNIIFSLAIFFILFSIFIYIYIFKFHQVKGLLYRMTVNDAPLIIDKRLHCFESLTFYLKDLLKFQLGKTFTLIFLLSIPFFLANKKNEGQKLFLTYIFSPLLIFTFIPTKWPEYTMPILPMVSMITISGFLGVNKDKVIVPLLIAIFAYGTFSFRQDIIMDMGRLQKVRYANTRSSRETLNKIFEIFNKGNKPIQVWTLINCDIPLSPALSYYKYTKTKRDIVFADLLSVSYPKGPIEIFKEVADYVLYCSDNDDLGWPQLDDIKRQYSKLPVLDKELKEIDFMKIIEAKKYFREIKSFRGDYGNHSFYFCIYENIIEDKQKRKN